MQKLYLDTRPLDDACRASYGLTEEIMMENAAVALEQTICELAYENEFVKNVVILCGGGNNGADGYALARRLRFDFIVNLIVCSEPKSHLCLLQAERAEKAGVSITEISDKYFEILDESDIIVDCIFGSGFHGKLSENIQTLLNDVNALNACRIACDVPTGLDVNGIACEGTFCADITVTMGALKIGLYSDFAKDFCGQIVCANLGVSSRLFENASNDNLSVASLLEDEDFNAPHRYKNNVNKGTFGHCVIACGQKTGAALIACKSAFRFGAGLVSLVCLNELTDKNFLIPMEIMKSTCIPPNCSAIAFGMGLGRDNSDEEKWFKYSGENKNIPVVIDADACYSKYLKDLLKNRPEKIVLTPHPKEFQAILKNCGLGEYSVEDCIKNRIDFVKKFCLEFPKITLLVKGANPVIATFNGNDIEIYINPLGKPCLAKGGSGDVLSGLIASLLAQGYDSKNATINASLAHAIASNNIKNDFSMTPEELINEISAL